MRFRQPVCSVCWLWLAAVRCSTCACQCDAVCLFSCVRYSTCPCTCPCPCSATPPACMHAASWLDACGPLVCNAWSRRRRWTCAGRHGARCARGAGSGREAREEAHAGPDHRAVARAKTMGNDDTGQWQCAIRDGIDRGQMTLAMDHVDKAAAMDIDKRQWAEGNAHGRWH